MLRSAKKQNQVSYLDSGSGATECGLYAESDVSVSLQKGEPEKMLVTDGEVATDEATVEAGALSTDQGGSIDEVPSEAVPLSSEAPSKKENLYVSVFIEASQNKPYTGYELLQSILTSGLRYGKQGVFHFYPQHNDQQTVWFSLASAVEPGVFDLPKMGGFSTPALTLYMNAKQVDDPVMIFEKMLSVANELVDNLGGRVLTSKQELVTKEHVRELCIMLSSVEREKSNLDLFEVMA